MAIIRNTRDKCWRGCRDIETLITVGGNVNCYNHYGKQYGGSSLALKAPTTKGEDKWHTIVLPNLILRGARIKRMFLVYMYCCCSSVTKLCQTLCDPMNCSTPGFLVIHYLLEFAQTPVHWVRDAIQPSHLLLPPSPPQTFPASGSFPASQLFTSGGQSIQASASASVLSMNIHGWFPLGLPGLISLLCKALWSVFSSTTVQKHQFFVAQPSVWFNSHICTWLLEKQYF